MNANTILGYRGGTLRNQIGSLALATTTETAFKLNTDDGLGATAVLTVPSQTAILGSHNPLNPAANAAIQGPAYGRIFGSPHGVQKPFFTSDYFSGRPFQVRMSGVGNAGANAAQTVLADLTLGTSATVGSNVILATTGAALMTVAGGAFSFSIVADLLWDLTTQIVGGYFSAAIIYTSKAASQVTAQAILTNFGTAIASSASLSFVPFIKFGNAAASTAQLTEFAIDEI